ncbi:MAG: alpha/beta hydrolase [Bdellovibrionota bacterium]
MKSFFTQFAKGSIAYISRVTKIVVALSVLHNIDAAAVSNYEEGRIFCAKESLQIQMENGTYVPVPIDYLDPKKGTTEIYAWFARPYQSDKPTFILFTGGPGQSSHLLSVPKFHVYRNLGWNLLLFDQKGVACSRPKTEVLFNSTDYYSSENVARDAEEIRKYFNIPVLSVYGASYGTATATIYASLFPTVVKAVILGGDDVHWT